MREDQKNELFLEIKDQPHQMWAEGSADTAISKVQVFNAVKDRGFIAANIDIWFDEVQGFWRFHCSIENKQLTNQR